MGYNKSLLNHTLERTNRLDDKILPLVYTSNCSGAVVIDKSQTATRDYGYFLRTQDAVAQKFIPTSKCLSSIRVSLSLPFSTRDVDEGAIIQIRRDSGGIPLGNPNDSQYLGQYVLPRGRLSTVEVLLSVPLDIELQDSDLINGVWIVITSGIYDPSYYVADPLYYLKIGAKSGLSGSYTKDGVDYWKSTTATIYYQTFKQTFIPPIVCPNPAVVLTIPT